jgi:hypothetical protein
MPDYTSPPVGTYEYTPFRQQTQRVPHVTLKSVANTPDIKEGMTREQIDAAIARHADKEGRSPEHG